MDVELMGSGEVQGGGLNHYSQKKKSRNGQTHRMPCFIGWGWRDAFVLASGRHRNPPLGGLKNKSRI